MENNKDFITWTNHMESDLQFQLECQQHASKLAKQNNMDDYIAQTKQHHLLCNTTTYNTINTDKH